MEIIGVVANNVTLKTKIHQWTIMGLNRPQELFKVHAWDISASGAANGGADALAQRTDMCGEAALEFCK